MLQKEDDNRGRSLILSTANNGVGHNLDYAAYANGGNAKELRAEYLISFLEDNTYTKDNYNDIQNDPNPNPRIFLVPSLM